MRSVKSKTALALALLVATLGANAVQPAQAQDRADRVVVPRELPSYRDVVKKVLPAVVSVEAVGKSSNRQAARGAEEQIKPDELPGDLRKYFDEMQKRRGATDRIPRPFASGSGFIIDPKGIVVTNNHVVAGADSVKITLKDGRPFVSTSIVTDPKTDIAVVKINSASPLPYLEIGDSDAMEIGDRVLAVGAPFGLTGTVTSGIVSGKGRVLGMSNDSIEDFIQTDAAINPGNSGGPVVNLAGQVIGMSTAIKSQSGGFQGIGLAVPSNMMKDVAMQLAKDGTVRRGYLGIAMQDLTPDVADKLRIPNAKGVIVLETTPNAPAAKAGLKEGDVVTSINGKPTEDMRTLQRSVLSVPLGKSAELGVLRGGKPVKVNVTIEQRPDDYGVVAMDRRRGARNNDNAAGDSVAIEKLGIDVTDATPALTEKLGYREMKGVIITNVEPGSAAQLAGLGRGMMITEAERKPVESAEELKDALAKAPLDEGIILFVRVPAGPAQYVIVKNADE